MAKPEAPAAAEVTPAGPSRALRIAWTIPDADPQVAACTVKVRIVGSSRWHSYDHSTGLLVSKGGATVPADISEVVVTNCEDGIEYEAVIAAMNSNGWGDVSPASTPVCIGELKRRDKPSRPLPPRLTVVGPGKLRCVWDLPQESCPSVEASQLQLTDVSRKKSVLVDAVNGKLVTSGRTTFAAPRCEANINGVEDGVEYVIAVCCRNAEGFSEYSQDSDCAIIVDPRMAEANSMQLVLHSGPSEGEAPVLEPLPAGQGKMHVRWVLPANGKSTMVKLRRTGDNNWYLCGGTTIQAPIEETIASGLEEGIEYEAMVAFLVGGRWCGESPISRPACIGDKLLPAIPCVLQEPRLTVLDQSRMKVRWQLVTAVPSLIGTAVRFRPLGGKVWMNVHPANGLLVDEGVEEPDLFAVPIVETVVENLKPGIRYEAAVAVRNKLGLSGWSNSSDVACIGRPIPKPIRCTCCFHDYDIQHADYSKDPDLFWCPVCRFRHMDPFNAVIEPYGLLLCHLVTKNVISFCIDLTELKSWRKDENDVYMRTVKIDSDTSAQVWPRKLTLEANGHEVFIIKEPEEGHVRRDVPMNITANLKPGMNTMKIVIEDPNPSAFAMSFVRTQAKTAADIAAEIPTLDEEAARERVCRLLGPVAKKDEDVAEEALEAEENGNAAPTGSDSDEEITCVISNKLKLRCPLSFERVQIPVRGEQCMHLQCFGLGAYLESNMKMRALNNRWTCPVCSTVLKPQDLRVDAFVGRVLAETSSHVEEVAITQDGSYYPLEDSVIHPAGSPAEDGTHADNADDWGDDGPILETVTFSVGDEKTALERRKERKAREDANLAARAEESPAKKRQRRRQQRRMAAAAKDSDAE
eukprot:TRINITY_DN29606_c0_g2_i1.p1 TRINITY_DN29606_c0_g2~~TRINITY_DN29606_c0_g2_i1.p1  ORF type:complete len:880 (+),score=146.74 TRINITY_DN29606_c0_g2_i1:54-2642(+)